jgi:hypothetical protein
MPWFTAARGPRAGQRHPERFDRHPVGAARRAGAILAPGRHPTGVPGQFRRSSHDPINSADQTDPSVCRVLRTVC